MCLGREEAGLMRELEGELERELEGVCVSERLD